MAGDHLKETERTRLRRKRQRGSYERTTVHAIIDATPMCYVGYVINGEPRVTPTLHWRQGEHIYWHGSQASGGLAAATDERVCVAVGVLDGFVLGRSGLHHSANYRSVMVFGKPTRIQCREEKLERLKAFVDNLFPDRWKSLRPSTREELDATTVLSLPINETSAKMRSGRANDPEKDLAHPVWAGTVPVRLVVDAPVPDGHVLEGVGRLAHVRCFERDWRW
ncbi:MAG: pyridoxamine 5'-phosphate oxidase family protein [Gammaproteobacteria bacterium]|nr:pyridoxamine 5'-phosphate oxidase family protein [Gammaproteobacteria bacterium]MDE0361400.1 pyridoxamine 5'-phosphate oxidase family protein [Rhodospirillaceae bacterium]